MPQPIVIQSHIRNSNESPNGARIGLSFDDIFYFARTIRYRVHIHIENLFPHGNEITEVTLLPGILLRHLELDCLIAFL